MLWPYALGSDARSEPARIDAWIPPGAWKLERHAIDVPVDSVTALAALGDVRLRDVPVVAALIAMRGIPHHRDMTLRQFFSTSPFLLLDEEAGREVVFGVVGPFWQIRRGHLPATLPVTPNDFRGVLARGRMAAIGNFRVEPTATGSRVSTETWVAIHALGQAVPFTTYWLLIGPFSAWIRRLLLRAGRSRALLLAFPPASSVHRSA